MEAACAGSLTLAARDTYNRAAAAKLDHARIRQIRFPPRRSDRPDPAHCENSALMKIHEFQAKEILRKAGRGRAPRHCRPHARGGRGGLHHARRTDGGGQSPDSCRRPRQGNDQVQRPAARRATGQKRQAGGRSRRQPARPIAGHDPDRARWPNRAPGAGRRRLQHRPRVVPGHRRRPRRHRAGADGLQPKAA